MTHGLLELGEVMLASSERRLEVVSRNVSNTSTPGFKKQTAFNDVMAMLGPAASKELAARTFIDFSQGALRATGRPLDLAISGPGFFKVRSNEGEAYFSRGGSFQRSISGHMVDPHGLILQTSDGKDLVLGEASIEILGDGTVLESGLPIARVGVFQAEDGTLEAVGGSLFRVSNDAVADVESPVIRAGMIESANVELAAEMVEMMEALRVAESGSRIVQTYDALIGQTISTFGRTA